MTDLDTLIESAVTDAITAGEGKIIGRLVREAIERAGLLVMTGNQLAQRDADTLRRERQWETILPIV